MSIPQQRPVIGISIGDLNGIGTELAIKTFSDNRLLEICTPILFASNKLINFYRKSIPDSTFNYQHIKDLSRPFHKQVNLFNCWDEEVSINPGQLTDAGGMYAIKSLIAATEALKDKKIDALVTAPILARPRETIPLSRHRLEELPNLVCGVDVPVGIAKQAPAVHGGMRDAVAAALYGIERDTALAGCGPQ